LAAAAFLGGQSRLKSRLRAGLPAPHLDARYPENKYMKSPLIQLDEPTLAALNRIAAPGKRKRSEFIRQAIRNAIRQAEYQAMREAYRKRPDSISDTDD
jgi:hypothetical protein